MPEAAAFCYFNCEKSGIARNVTDSCGGPFFVNYICFVFIKSAGQGPKSLVASDNYHTEHTERTEKSKTPTNTDARRHYRRLSAFSGV